MRSSAVILSLLGLLAAGQLSAQSSSEFRLLEWRAASPPDLHDGSMSEWSHVSQALIGADRLRPIGDGVSSVIEPPEVQISLSYLWEQQQILFGVSVQDDDVTEMDGVHLIVDGDSSGGQYAGWSESDLGSLSDGSEESSADLVSFLFMFQAQRYFIGPIGEDDLSMEHPEEHFADKLPFADGSSYLTPGGWSAEVAISVWDELNYMGPELSRRSVLSDRLSFQLVIQDYDTASGETRQYALGESNTEVYWNSSGLPTGSLIEYCATHCRGDVCRSARSPCWTTRTVVEATGWGLIKSSKGRNPRSVEAD